MHDTGVVVHYRAPLPWCPVVNACSPVQKTGLRDIRRILVALDILPGKIRASYGAYIAQEVIEGCSYNLG